MHKLANRASLSLGCFSDLIQNAFSVYPHVFCCQMCQVVDFAFVSVGHLEGGILLPLLRNG